MSDERDPATDQQLPEVNDQPFVQDLVLADIEARKQLGIRKYGTALQAGNGRNMLLDAYEEALDLAIYLRGALEEQGGHAVRVPTPEAGPCWHDSGYDWPNGGRPRCELLAGHAGAHTWRNPHGGEAVWVESLAGHDLLREAVDELDRLDAIGNTRRDLISDEDWAWFSTHPLVTAAPRPEHGARATLRAWLASRIGDDR